MSMKTATIAAAVATALCAAAAAADLKQEAFDLVRAKTVAGAAAAEAKRLGAGGAIAVVDDGGHLLYLERLDGTFPAAAAVAEGKARTAAIFRKDTRVFEESINNGRTALAAVGVMTPLQGGVPIVVDGRVVGAVGISGAMSAQQDEDIARLAARAIE